MLKFFTKMDLSFPEIYTPLEKACSDSHFPFKTAIKFSNKNFFVLYGNGNKFKKLSSSS